MVQTDLRFNEKNIENSNTIRALKIELNFLCPLPPTISRYAARQLHVTAKASPPISLQHPAMKTIHLKFVLTPSVTSHPHEVNLRVCPCLSTLSAGPGPSSC